MKYFNFTNNILLPNNTLTLIGKDYHYLIRVKRLKKGDTLQVRDIENNLFDSKILIVDDETCKISIGKRIKEPGNKIHITLIQSLLKGKKMELVVRQATECGVENIVLVESDHSILKINDISKKIERYRSIINEARQQSGSSTNTEVCDSTNLELIPIIDKKEEVGLFFHQEEIAKKSLAEYFNSIISKVIIIIGPEGGLSEREVKILLERGYNACYLGSNVLRAESAALYSIAAVQTVWGINE